jgi:hypothetical protein
VPNRLNDSVKVGSILEPGIVVGHDLHDLPALDVYDPDVKSELPVEVGEAPRDGEPGSGFLARPRRSCRIDAPTGIKVLTSQYTSNPLRVRQAQLRVSAEFGRDRGWDAQAERTEDFLVLAVGSTVFERQYCNDDRAGLGTHALSAAQHGDQREGESAPGPTACSHSENFNPSIAASTASFGATPAA